MYVGVSAVVCKDMCYRKIVIFTIRWLPTDGKHSTGL